MFISSYASFRFRCMWAQFTGFNKSIRSISKTCCLSNEISLSNVKVMK
jgi:hypothetical protein